MQYIVLRDLRRTHPTDPFGGGGRDFGLSLASGSPPAPSIALEELDQQARKELARDPAVVAITRPMPVQLIRPMADYGAGPAPTDDPPPPLPDPPPPLPDPPPP